MQQYKPLPFFLVTFLLTWTFWFIAAAFSYQEGMVEYQMLFILPGLFAPSIAALTLLSGQKSSVLRKDFFEKLRFNKIKPSFLPFLLLLAPFSILFATALSLFLGLPADQFAISDEYKVLKGQGLISLVILSLAPTFEELGWRGYGVDSLRSFFSLFKTSLLFGFLWAMWHLPLFFIKGYYHHTLWETNFLYVLNFFLSLQAASFLINWLYYKNGRSIICAIIFHFMLNLSYVLFQTDPRTKCIATVIMLLVVAILVFKDKKFFFEGAWNQSS